VERRKGEEAGEVEVRGRDRREMEGEGKGNMPFLKFRSGYATAQHA